MPATQMIRNVLWTIAALHRLPMSLHIVVLNSLLFLNTWLGGLNKQSARITCNSSEVGKSAYQSLSIILGLQFCATGVFHTSICNICFCIVARCLLSFLYAPYCGKRFDLVVWTYMRSNNLWVRGVANGNVTFSRSQNLRDKTTLDKVTCAVPLRLLNVLSIFCAEQTDLRDLWCLAILDLPVLWALSTSPLWGLCFHPCHKLLNFVH